ncbi:hypothetical protein A7982_13706 [Minicystis rosea]|nr:hypothetical protein A7982_13706 [Minicystis rosea]
MVERIRLLPAGNERAALVEAARHLLELASRESRLPGAFTFDPELGDELGRDELTAGVFTGLAGLGYVETLLGAALDDARLRDAGIARIERAYRKHCALAAPSGELFMGTAGYLALATDLGARGITGTSLTRVMAEAADRLGARHRRKTEPMNLGAAHGITGELLALLLIPDALPRPALEARLDELLSLATVEGDYIAWPILRGGEVPSPVWASFCNGVAGQTMLYARAFSVLGEDRYRTAALLGARTCFALAHGNATLCCGGGGAVTALALVGRALADSSFKRRSARRLAALEIQGSETCSRLLLQGDLGISWLGLLRAHREPIHFPLLRGLVHG